MDESTWCPPGVFMEMRITKVGANNTRAYLTEWYTEQFIIRDRPQDGGVLLSGLEMRKRLYFATAPGNHQLFVSVKKNGIVSRLPAV